MRDDYEMVFEQILQGGEKHSLNTAFFFFFHPLLFYFPPAPSSLFLPSLSSSEKRGVIVLAGRGNRTPSVRA